MKYSFFAVALLIVPAACVHAQRNPEPVIVPSLAAATLVPLGDLHGRELFVDEESFLKAERAVGGEEFRVPALRTQLDRPVRTDVDAVALVCPDREMYCHLAGNPFILSIDDAWREGAEIRIRVRYMYNLTVRGQTLRTVDRNDITVARVERGWRIVSVTKPTTH